MVSNKDKTNNLTNLPSSQAQPHSFLLILLHSHPPGQHRRTGNGGYCQFITFGVCCSFVLTFFPCSSVGLSYGSQSFINCPKVGPCRRLPFFINCSCVGPFHGLQSFRKRLLQPEFPTGCSSCQKTCPCEGYSPWGAMWISAPLWSFMVCRATTCVTMDLTRGSCA